MKNKSNTSVLLGAAFLMATSAIGPGFLTQTASFTEQIGADFAFVLIVSVILSLIAQLNVWRIICVSRMKGQDIANSVLYGRGHFIAVLVCLGGLVFNIGNVGGAALGLEVLFGLDLRLGALITAILAIGIFSSKEAGSLMDKLTQFLGAAMIVVILYVTVTTSPPLKEIAARTIRPHSVDLLTIVTLVGGTVGGYILFSGGHRLLDAGISGEDNIGQVNQSALMGMGVATIVRVLLFLAVMGVLASGVSLDPDNPPASAFYYGAGDLGYKIFGFVIFAAALSSVVGAAYTSVSFLTTLSPVFEKHENKWIMGFIAFSALIFIAVGNPVLLLIVAGSLNGLILPITLAIMLIASKKESIVGTYQHSTTLFVLGWIVVIVMAIFGIRSLGGLMALFN